MLRHARAIIRTLAQEEEYEHFRLPVDPAWVVDYKATVRRPIDLRAIDRKVRYGQHCGGWARAGMGWGKYGGMEASQ